MKREKKRIQVRETSAAKQIAAYIVLNRKREHVATIHAYFSDNSAGGVCRVDVWGPYELTAQKVAYGCGYDKFAAALDGCYVDGIRLYDHSAMHSEEDRKLAARLVKNQPSRDKQTEYWHKMNKKYGIQESNWNPKEQRYDSCHYVGGLKKLEFMGYTVITAI